MANQKVSELTGFVPDADDEIYVRDVSAGSSGSKKTTVEDLLSLGGGSDPLELVNYLSVGADPAQSGAIRLAAGDGVAWLGNPDESSGQDAGDISGISVQLVGNDVNGDYWNVIRLGERGGPLAREAIFDPYYERVFALFETVAFASYERPLYDHLWDGTGDDPRLGAFAKFSYNEFVFHAALATEGQTNYPTVQTLVGSYWEDDHAEDSEWRVGIKSLVDGYWFWNVEAAGLGDVIRIFEDGLVSMPLLPATDPTSTVGTGGLFVVDEAGLAAALGAGAKYVLQGAG